MESKWRLADFHYFHSTITTNIDTTIFVFVFLLKFSRNWFLLLENSESSHEKFHFSRMICEIFYLWEKIGDIFQENRFFSKRWILRNFAYFSLKWRQTCSFHHYFYHLYFKNFQLLFFRLSKVPRERKNSNPRNLFLRPFPFAGDVWRLFYVNEKSRRVLFTNRLHGLDRPIKPVPYYYSPRFQAECISRKHFNFE